MLLDDPSPLVRYALADALARAPTRRPPSMHALVERPAGHRRDRAGALAAAARFRSGRCDRGRRTPTLQAAIARRRDAAALGRGRDRRGRLGRGLPDADRESRTPTSRPFSLDRIVAALRASRGDPRVAARLAGPAGRDPSRAGGEAVRDARGLRGRAQLAGGGAGAAHRAGSLREGDRHPGGERRTRTRSRRWCSHLRQTGQLTAGLVLRSLLSGNIDFFEQALAELAELPVLARRRAGA